MSTKDKLAFRVGILLILCSQVFSDIRLQSKKYMGKGEGNKCNTIPLPRITLIFPSLIFRISFLQMDIVCRKSPALTP
jgi:hypothetical protein